MPSTALQQLLQALPEVVELLRSDPTPAGALPANPRLSRVVVRACVVLASSHLDRYLRAINEELVQAILNAQVKSDVIPEKVRVRLLYKRVDDLVVGDSAPKWFDRDPHLRKIMDEYSALWRPGEIVRFLETKPLAAVLNSPDPKKIISYYSQWGIPHIFGTIQSTSRRLPFVIEHKVKEMVDKRNNVAHGNVNVTACSWPL